VAKKTTLAPLQAAPSRADRVIVSIIITMFVITIGAFIALFIAAGRAHGGVWPSIELLPLIALPTALILMIVLVVRTAIRRGRDARDAGK
jgi:hypothetical protein